MKFIYFYYRPTLHENADRKGGNRFNLAVRDFTGGRDNQKMVPVGLRSEVREAGNWSEAMALAHPNDDEVFLNVVLAPGESDL